MMGWIPTALQLAHESFHPSVLIYVSFLFVFLSCCSVILYLMTTFHLFGQISLNILTFTDSTMNYVSFHLPWYIHNMWGSEYEEMSKASDQKMCRSLLLTVVTSYALFLKVSMFLCVFQKFRQCCHLTLFIHVHLVNSFSASLSPAMEQYHSFGEIVIVFF